MKENYRNCSSLDKLNQIILLILFSQPTQTEQNDLNKQHNRPNQNNIRLHNNSKLVEQSILKYIVNYNASNANAPHGKF